MIEIKQFSRDAVQSTQESPGGFVWWYADLVDSAGNGAVVIWSLGLPFLPGSRTRPVAASRPSFNLATYRQGRPDFFLLQEYSAARSEIDWLSGSGKLGESTFRIERRSGVVSVTVEIDVHVPASDGRVTGRMALVGPSLALSKPDRPVTHVWNPQGATLAGSLSLSTNEGEFQLDGRGYLDANLSAEPLQDQGIVRWNWGRVSFQDHSLVYYDLLGEGGVVERHAFVQTAENQGFVALVLGDQRARTQNFAATSFRRGFYGLVSARKVKILAPLGAYEVNCTQLVDDGPFYQRFLVVGRSPTGEEGHGLAECVAPPLVDVPWQRPFVRMRIHRPGGDNSRLLPLFTGPRDRRLNRFLRSVSPWRSAS